MIAPARTAALRALRTLASGSADLPGALAAARAPLRDERDRALATDIVSGTVRWQRRLDYTIAALAGRPVDAIDPDVRLVLRVSAYQILFLDRIPASAIVDDAVDLARSVHHARAAGFVNAVLRALVRRRQRPPVPDAPPPGAELDTLAEYLGIVHSHPTWLVRRWLASHGRDATERWLAFDNERPALTLRVNPIIASRAAARDRLQQEGVETEPTTFAPLGLRITSGLPEVPSPDGLFVVQDEASQLVPLAVGVSPGDRVLDLCASPGGKATALAAALEPGGHLVACDVRDRRIRLLRETVARSRLPHLSICRVSGSGPLPFTQAFSRVLVDAPCSGLGTLRRDPDIRWRRHASDLEGLAARQRELLARAAAVVMPGGRLVYATCSGEPEENEEVVDAFLQGGAEFSLLDLRHELAPALWPLLDARGCLRTWPFTHRLEAFFAAALVRRPAAR